MKRIALLLLTLIIILCLSATALAVSTDQLQGYQAKKKTWQYIQFGSYPTDADGTVRPILWRVLEVKEQQAYLMSEYILFAHRVDPNCYPVNKKTKEYAGWETSELFNYLNQEFLTAAFTEAEQTALIVQQDGGLVSLPDAQDVKNKNYGFTAEKLRQSQSTAYAKANGLFVYQGAKQYSPYWLRTPSESKKYAQRKVQDDGKLGYISVEVADVGARPVIRLDLTKLTSLEGEGTTSDPFRPVLSAPAADTQAETDTTDDTGSEQAASASEDETTQPETSPETSVRFESEHAAMFPTLTDEGFQTYFEDFAN